MFFSNSHQVLLYIKYLSLQQIHILKFYPTMCWHLEVSNLGGDHMILGVEWDQHPYKRKLQRGPSSPLAMGGRRGEGGYP